MAMTETERRMTGDDAALAAFFRAARTSGDAPLPAALLADILADAAAVTAERRPALPVRQAPPRQRPWSLRRLFGPVGGWPGAAVLGASAALGFWIGIAGGVSIDSSTGTMVTDSDWSQSWSRTASGDDAATDSVASFYDYAALEG